MLYQKLKDMMITYIILLILLMKLNFTYPKYHTWLHEHNICYTEITLNHDFNKDTATYFGTGQISSHVVCNEASYLEYVKKELNKTNEIFEQTMLLAIMNLYSDLELSRKPSIVSLNYDKNTSILVYPISFAIPESYVVRTVPPKTKEFGRVIPGDISTYFKMEQESEYRDDMSNSLFVLTYKKGGWDCLRHYEILAAGAAPLFLDIVNSPKVALSAHPKKLYKQILEWPGLRYNATRSETNRHLMKIDTLEFNLSSFNIKLYMAMNAALRQYTLNVLTTRAMASYLLETIRSYQNQQLGSNQPIPKNVLYLTHHDADMNKGDYLTDMILHGLIEVLGEKSVTDFPQRDPVYKREKDFNKSSEYFPNRKRLYGFGFSWGQLIDDWEVTDSRNYAKIDSYIENNIYDLIILGSGHRDGYRSILNFWSSICKYYKPYQIAFIDGADYHLRAKTLKKYAPCVGLIFSREGPLIVNDKIIS